MTIAIDWARARQVVGQALTAYRANAYPYQDRFLPQDAIPENIRADSLAYALILFYSCHYMRGTIRSDYAMRQMVRLHERAPGFFDPRAVLKLGIPRVTEGLKSVLAYKAEEIGNFWFINSRRLELYWRGDPRSIFEEVHDINDLYRFVVNKDTTRGVPDPKHRREKGFLGFQKKMASMLAYFLEECGLIPTLPVQPVPPVDFHHIRILVATGAITPTNGRATARYEELQPFGIEILETYLRESGAGMLEVANALWVLSNRLCARSPVTKTREGELVAPNWTSKEDRERYERTCGSCPVSTLCTKAVQANVYYQKGYFEINRERPTPPGATPLLPLDLPRVFRRNPSKKASNS